MANKTQMEYTINVRAKTDQAINDIKALGNTINSALAKGGGNAELVSSLEKINKIANNITDTLNKPVTKQSQLTSLTDNADKIGLELDKLLVKLKEVQSSDNNKKLSFVDKDAITQLTNAKAAIEDYKKALGDTEKSIKALETKQNDLDKNNQTWSRAAKEVTKAKKALEDAKKQQSDFNKLLEKRNNLESNLKHPETSSKLDNIKKQLEQAVEASPYGSERTAAAAGEGKWSNVVEAEKDLKIAEKNLETARNKAKETQTEFNNLQKSIGAAALKAKDDAWTQLSSKLKTLGIDISNINSGDSDAVLQIVNDKQLQQLATADTTIEDLITKVKNLTDANQESRKEIEQNTQQWNELSERFNKIINVADRAERLVGFAGAIKLIGNACRSAISTIRELDKVMTETAVVTDYTVSDMWGQLEAYANRASSLGVAIKDVYEASTLYYQQGLTTNQVTSLTTETLKMARIAGLQAEEATNRMTAALRGFNMELNETNAQNIADVYSKLAAITASDVDEISTAMSKVASLANSANMSFENTSAFLAQIINISVTCSRKAA